LNTVDEDVTREVERVKAGIKETRSLVADYNEERRARGATYSFRKL